MGCTIRNTAVDDTMIQRQNSFTYKNSCLYWQPISVFTENSIPAFTCTSFSSSLKHIPVFTYNPILSSSYKRIPFFTYNPFQSLSTTHSCLCLILSALPLQNLVVSKKSVSHRLVRYNRSQQVRRS